MIKIVKVKEISDSVKQKFSSHPDFTVFHESGFLLSYQRRSRFTKAFIIIDDKQQLLIPFITNIFPLCLSFLNEALIIASPLYQNSHILADGFEMLTKFCIKKKVAVVSLSAYYQEKNPDFLKKQGFIVFSNNTFIINPQKSEQELWLALHKKNRHLIKKAGRMAVKIKLAQKWQDWQRYHHLYKETINRAIKKGGKNLSAKSLDEFRAVYQFLSPKKNAHLFLAEQGADLLAGALILNAAQKAYFWTGATSLQKRSYGANNLLHWEIITWARKQGFTSYDLGGTPDVNEQDPLKKAIRCFKKDFGGEEKFFFTGQKVLGPWAYRLRRLAMPALIKLYDKTVKN